MFFFKQPSSSSPSSSFSSAIVHLRVGCTSPYLFTLLVLIFSFHILCSKDFMFTFSGQLFDAYNSCKSSSTNKMGPKVPFAAGTEAEGGCDIFSGRWVWDNHRPLYEESECPYIPPQLTCQKHGRPDRDYQHWRWQPHGCSLPSFNATLILETLRNKRMMFVGDSLHRGQLVSLACLLHRIIPNHAIYANITSDFMNLFEVKEYNATFEFYWAPFLLASSSDNAILHTISNKQFIRMGSINEQGQHWKGFDILVFNTYMWWTKNPNVTMLQGSYDDIKKANVVQVPVDEAYRMAIQGMVEWVEENMDPDKTRVFFTNMSPMHGKSREWGGNAKGNCYNETSLIQDPNYWGSNCRKNAMNMIGEMFRKSKYPITFLNITQLSSYRKDAHTSIYKKQWKPLTREQLKDPASYADCVHWCLPGLQDTWNELLFAKLLYP